MTMGGKANESPYPAHLELPVAMPLGAASLRANLASTPRAAAGAAYDRGVFRRHWNLGKGVSQRKLNIRA